MKIRRNPSRLPGKLIRVDSARPSFVAGVLVNAPGLIYKAAPIMGYAVGWTETRLREYASQRQWKLESLP